MSGGAGTLSRGCRGWVPSDWPLCSRTAFCLPHFIAHKLHRTLSLPALPPWRLRRYPPGARPGTQRAAAWPPCVPSYRKDPLDLARSALFSPAPPRRLLDRREARRPRARAFWIPAPRQKLPNTITLTLLVFCCRLTRRKALSPLNLMLRGQQSMCLRRRAGGQIHRSELVQIDCPSHCIRLCLGRSSDDEARQR